MTEPNKLNAREVREIRQAWIDGASLRDLSAEYDVSHAAIRYQVRGLDRDAKPRTNPQTFDRSRAVRLVRQGFSLREVASRFGVTPPAILRAVRAEAQSHSIAAE